MTSQLTRDELNKVLARIRKLHAKAESCKDIGSMEEAEAFMAAVAKTLAKYKLEMTDVEIAIEEKAEPIGSSQVKHSREGLDPHAAKSRWKRSPFLEHLAIVVARAHYCRILVTQGSSTITFVGRPTDREIAIYIFQTLVAFEAREESRAYWKHRKATPADIPIKGFRTDFKRGFLDKVRERYRAEEAALRTEVKATGHGTALVRLDTAHAQVDSFIKSMGTGRVRGTTLGRSTNATARAAGSEAGSRAHIRGAGLNKGGSTQKHLGG